MPTFLYKPKDAQYISRKYTSKLLFRHQSFVYSYHFIFIYM